VIHLAEVFDVTIDDLISRNIARNGVNGPQVVGSAKKDESVLLGVIKRLERYVTRLEGEMKQRDPGLEEETGID